jgi:hypothetical protein
MTSTTVQFPQFDGVRRHESDVRPGVVAFAGIDLRSGPGTFFFEGRFVHAPTQIPSLRGSSVEPLTLSLGYRLYLFP